MQEGRWNFQRPSLNYFKNPAPHISPAGTDSLQEADFVKA
jgi:hypothetical protein